MGQEKIIATAEDVIKAYQSIGKTPKQLDALAFEASETPLSGYIGRLIPEPKEYQGNKYFVYEVLDAIGGNVIGEMSVNRLFDTEVKEGDILIVQSEQNAGKAMLRSHRLSSTSKFGKSRAEQIAKVIGSSYTAERVTGRVITDYKPEKLFVTPKKKDAITDAEKKALWNNTSVSERLMRIEF